MPPPGSIKHHAVGDVITEPEIGIVGEDQPEVVQPLAGQADTQTPAPPVADGPLPLPPLEGKKERPKKGNLQYLASPEPESGPSTTAVPAAASGAPAGSPEPIPDEQALAVPQGTPAQAGQPYSQLPNNEALAVPQRGQVPKAPAPAPNNWAQRLGLAALSLTKFGPIANQLIHPKWAEQNAAYQRQIGGIQTQAALDQEAAKTQQEQSRATEFQALADKATAQARTFGDKKFKLSGGKLYNLETGEVTEAPMGAQDKYDEAIAIGATPEQATAYGLGWKMDLTKQPKTTAKLPASAAATLGLDPNMEVDQQHLPAFLNAATEASKLENQSPQKQVDIRKGIAANIPGLSPKDRMQYELTGRFQEYAPTNVNVGFAGMPTNTDPNLHGEEYLKTLPPDMVPQVRAVAEGRDRIPPASSRSEKDQQLRAAAFRYDPELSETRAQGRKAFGPGGKLGATTLNLNTATVHLDQYQQIAKALQNGQLVPGNNLYNYFAQQLGAPPPLNAEALRQAVAGEMDAGLHGSSTIEGRTAMLNTMPVGASPDQIAGFIDTHLHTLGAKLGQIHQQYHQYEPSDKIWSPVSPSAKVVYSKHGFNPTEDSRIPVTILTGPHKGTHGMVNISQFDPGLYKAD